MSNLSKSSFFDAGKNPPRKRTVRVNGERRVERIPNGKAELWVDSNGNVRWHQIVKPGQPPSLDAEAARRAELRRAGRIELSRCPLERGGALSRHDFPAEMRTECSDHRKGACPHVRFIIAERRGAYAHLQTTKLAAARRRETEEREREDRKIAAQEELNANISRLADLVAGRAAPASGDVGRTSDSPAEDQAELVAASPPEVAAQDARPSSSRRGRRNDIDE